MPSARIAVLALVAALAVAALAVAAPAEAAAPGNYRLTSTQGPGNEMTIEIGADGRTVEDTNSFVYDLNGTPYCVWGGSLRGAPLDESPPSPIGDDGSFTWHAADDSGLGAQVVDTVGRFTSATTVEATVTMNNCPFDNGGVSVHFTGGLSSSPPPPPPPPPPPASGSVSLLDPDPPVAPGGKPGAGHGYPAPPATTAGCEGTVKVGELEGRAACWRRRGDVESSDGRARVNGIDLTPTKVGGHIRIDRRTQRISSDGPAEVRVGPLVLLRAPIDWRARTQVFKGEQQKFLGLPVKGSVELKLEGGRTKLALSVGVPDSPLVRSLIRYEHLTGDLTVAATNDAGIVLDAAKLTFPGIDIGFVAVDDAELAISRPSASVYHYDGKATVYAFPRATIGIGGEFGIGAGDDYVKVGASVESLNRPLWGAVFLQMVGLTMQFNPFGWTGRVAATAGPQFRFRDQLISTARLDGALAYLSGAGGEPSSLELSGALKLMGEVNTGDGKLKVSGGRVDLSGHAEFKVASYGLDGTVAGWVASGGLNAEGKVKLTAPKLSAEGEGVLSTRGLAACRRGFGPDVGFGYRWGGGFGGIDFMAHACDIGPWREIANAALSAVGARAGVEVRVHRGMRQLTLAARSAAGTAPDVAFVAPDGTRYAPSADVINTDRVYAVRDPDTGGAYFAITRPEPGRWRIEPLPGSVPVTRYQSAAPLARVGIRARVRGRGAQRTLAVTLRHRSGARVTFVEQGSRSRRVIGSVARRRERLRFRPALGPGGRRTIIALVERGGRPDGTSRRVARYRTRAMRPARPTRVRIRRAGFTRRISWRGHRGALYVVDVRTSDGRHLRFTRRGRRGRVVVPRVPRGGHVRVRVTSIAPAGVASRTAAARR